MLDGKPNGDRLRARRWNSTAMRQHPLESHGPYQRGYSVHFPGVNGVRSLNSDESLVPPLFQLNSESGAGHKNTFVSEFGATGFSSFESVSALLPRSAWSAHGGTDPDICKQKFENENNCVGNNPMAER